jgi:hypothetical protein
MLAPQAFQLSLQDFSSAPFDIFTFENAWQMETDENDQDQGEADYNYFDQFNATGIKGFLNRKAAGEKGF